MANYEEFKKKAGETAEFVADRTVELAKYAAEKTVILARITRLKAELSMERDDLKRSRVELGKAYYDRFGHDLEDDKADVCAKVGVSLDVIAGKKREIEELKLQLREKPFSAEEAEEAETESAGDEE